MRPHRSPIARFALLAVVTAVAALPGAAASQDAAVERYRFHVGRDAPLGGAFGPPTALAVDRAGAVYAAEPNAARIVRFDAAGDVIGAWGGPGDGPGEISATCGDGPHPRWQFCGASDLAIGPDGDVYAADPFNGRIQRFKPWGTFVAQLCPLGPAADDVTRCRRSTGTRSAAWSVAVGPDGRVFVAEALDGVIRVLESDGRVAADWPQRANDLAVTVDGDIVTAQAAEVVVLDGAGQPRRRLGTLNSGFGGHAPGGFFGCDSGASPIGGPAPPNPCGNPRAVAVGPDGAVYALDRGGVWSAIHRFAGDDVRLLGLPLGPAAGPSPHPGPAGLYDARRIAVGPDGTIYVADTRAGIAVLNAAGVWQRDWTLRAPAAPPASAVGDAAFDAPEAVARVGAGIAVADSGRGRVQWLAGDGTLLRSSAAAVGGGLIRPVAVAEVPGDGVVVADAVAGRVRHLDAAGAPGRSWGEPPAADAPFGAFTSVLAMADGAVLAADNTRGRIVRIPPDGGAAAEWSPGTFARRPGERNVSADRFWLDGRYDLAEAPGGDVVVLDVLQNRLVRLRADGRVISDRPLAASIQWPRGVEVAPNGDVLVLDAAPAHVVRLGADGEPTSTFGAGTFTEPTGMAAGADGTVVVTARRTDHTYWFDAAGTLMAERVVVLASGEAASPQRVTAAADGGFLFTASKLRSGAFLAAVLVDGAGATRREWWVQGGGEAGLWRLGWSDAAATTDGGLWLATRYAPGHLLRLDADGSLVRDWRFVGDAPGRTWAPSGVAVGTGPDGRREVFVADAAVDRIIRFDWDGAFEAEALAGLGGAPLARPRHIAAAADGTLWVAEEGNSRVVRFDRELRALGAVTGGAADGEALVAPYGVAVAPDGSLRVTDAQRNRVWSARSDGTLVRTWSDGAGPPGTRLLAPRGLAFAADGTLWIADALRERVVAFGAVPDAGWHVQLYRDGALLDGPVAAFHVPSLDLDWAGQPPAPGVAATGFSLRAERVAPPGPSRRVLDVAVRGGATLIAPHGRAPVLVAGDPAAQRVTTDLVSDRDWLRVDFAAAAPRPMLRLVMRGRSAYFPIAMRRHDAGR